jgi:hypothetical protein
MSAQAEPSAEVPKRGRRWGLWVAGGLLLAIAALVVWLVFFWGVMRKSWSEEVQIAAGEVIVVKRRMKLVKIYPELRPVWTTRFEAMRLPDGVRFETEDRIVFVRLERGPRPGTWVLIGSPLYCEEFNKYGRPKPDYIQFEYVNGRWTYRPVQPEFLGRQANLLISDRYARNGSRVTLADKEQWNSTSERVGRRYLEILASSHQDECWTVDITNRR